MRTLFFTAILTLLTWLTLRRLSPETFGVTGKRLFFATAIVVHVAWAAVYFTGPHAEGLGRTMNLATRAAAGSWSIAMLICLLAGAPLLLGRYVLSKFGGKPRDAAPSPLAGFDPARRRLLASALPVAAVTTGAGGTISGLQAFEVKEETVHLPNLPAALDGFRIGQLTDVHIGDYIDTDYLASAVEALNTAGCDLQVMTGDLIDDLSQLGATMAALERVKAPHGMLAILGNHEKWRDADAVCAAYAECAPRGKLKLLLDEHVRIEHKGEPLFIAGVDYPMHNGGRHRLPKEERDAMMQSSADKAFAGARADETVLCLTHHPDFFRFAAAKGARLTLAGHTHGGQVGLFGVPLFGFAFEHMLGRYKKKDPAQQDAHLYVSGGTGHWLPFRIGVPAEVTVLTLRRA